MKSIGLAIVQAQAGMFVPCTEMHYVPFNEIFTRIQSNDNILKGLSTFSNEIIELRNIFKRVSQNSLVIGDELCAGTESISALAIVTAGMETLVSKRASFVFATHLHELNHMPRIRRMITDATICIKHLSVEYDESTGKLIYDRCLKSGPGSSLYGLEVCKAMDMSSEFVHKAFEIRHELLGNGKEIVAHKVSRYNSNVIVDHCMVCRSEVNIETHHIIFQQHASSDGFINNTFHKNADYNLVTLCKKCHNDVHANHLCIHGWVQTDNGVELKFTYNKGGNNC
jgi:DNA mismatch repair protein MutS